MHEAVSISDLIGVAGNGGVTVVLLWFLLKTLPDFRDKLTETVNENTRLIAESIKEFSGAVTSQTIAINALLDKRKEDTDTIRELRDAAQGTYRMVNDIHEVLALREKAAAHG